MRLDREDAQLLRRLYRDGPGALRAEQPTGALCARAWALAKAGLLRAVSIEGSEAPGVYFAISGEGIARLTPFVV